MVEKGFLKIWESYTYSYNPSFTPFPSTTSSWPDHEEVNFNLKISLTLLYRWTNVTELNWDGELIMTSIVSAFYITLRWKSIIQTFLFTFMQPDQYRDDAIPKRNWRQNLVIENRQWYHRAGHSSWTSPLDSFFTRGVLSERNNESAQQMHQKNT